MLYLLKEDSRFRSEYLYQCGLDVLTTSTCGVGKIGVLLVIGTQWTPTAWYPTALRPIHKTNTSRVPGRRGATVGLEYDMARHRHFLDAMESM